MAMAVSFVGRHVVGDVELLTRAARLRSFTIR